MLLMWFPVRHPRKKWYISTESCSWLDGFCLGICGNSRRSAVVRCKTPKMRMKAGIFGVFKCTLRQLIFHQVSRMMNEKERYMVTIQSQADFLSKV